MKNIKQSQSNKKEKSQIYLILKIKNNHNLNNYQNKLINNYQKI